MAQTETGLKQRGMRIGFLVELIVAIGLGFAAIRWAERNEHVRQTRSFDPFVVTKITTYVNPFVMILSLAGLVAVVCERLSGRRPACFGVGRWIWASTGGFVLANALREFVRWRTTYTRATINPGTSSLLSLPAGFSDWFGGWLFSGSGGAITSTILGVCIAYWVARPCRGVRADGREWTGRAFGFLVVAWSIVLHALWFMNVKYGWLA